MSNPHIQKTPFWASFFVGILIVAVLIGLAQVVMKPAPTTLPVSRPGAITR